MWGVVEISGDASEIIFLAFKRSNLKARQLSKSLNESAFNLFAIEEKQLRY